tara:strand:- start:9858 stop:11858 length:2001 start_codon:yes stop_codon:yes gene_type:complete
MNKKSIIFLGTTSYSYPLNNTQEKKFSTLSQYHDTSVIAFYNKAKFKTFKKGANFYLLPHLPSRALRFLSLILIGPILALRLAKRDKITFLVAQDPHQGFVAALSKSLGRLTGKKIKLIVENHGDFERSIFIQKKIGASNFNKRVFSWLAKFTFKRADALRGVSIATVDQLKKWNNSVPIIKFPAWTDIEVFSSAKQKDQLTNPTIIFAGALAPIKGVEYLIDAFNKIIKHCPQAKLLIVGKEEDQKYVAGLKQQIRNYNLDNNIEFVGEVPQQQLADMFSSSNVFVLPSLSEGLGRVVFEAMAAGLPVVGSRVGGVPDLIDDGITGWLVEPRDVNGLTEKILRLITNSAEAKAMGERGREFAKSFFSSGSYLENYNNLFSLAEGGRKPDFIGLGAQRSGTSWIYSCLYEHPEIYSPIKEIHFFSRERNWPKGYSWYENVLVGAKKNQKVGEFSTSYLADKKTPQRIYQQYPDAKLIMVLRNPVDRAFSNYVNDIMAGTVKTSVSFAEALAERDEYVINGMYAIHLKNYLKFFSRDNILILIHEDIKKDSAVFMKRIYQFIGVNDNFSPSSLNKKINVGRVPRFVWLDRLFVHISKAMRLLGMHKIWWLIKKKGLAGKILAVNTKTDKKVASGLIDSDRQKLKDIFRGEVRDLESIVGYKIDSWNI